jgi:hypothetical protein
VTASLLIPISVLLSFSNIAFRIGPILFNRSSRDDGKASYGDLLISIVSWVLSYGNALFLVWLHDAEGSFATLEDASASLAWMRLNFSAITVSCGIGQGMAQAKSLAAEGVLAYFAAITFTFVAVYIGGIGVAAYRAVVQQKDILHSK